MTLIAAIFVARIEFVIDFDDRIELAIEFAVDLADRINSQSDSPIDLIDGASDDVSSRSCRGSSSLGLVLMVDFEMLNFGLLVDILVNHFEILLDGLFQC